MEIAVANQTSETALARTMDYIANAKAQNTLRAYRSDWADFTGWCAECGREALPASPETVALYVSDRAAMLKPATLRRRIAAISQAHQAAGAENPTTSAPVRLAMQGIRRVHGCAQDRVDPVVVDDLRAMLATLDDSLAGLRDRALMLVGFAGAFRRSELVSLDAEDIEYCAEGVVVTLRRSKTDQSGEGHRVALPYGVSAETCPVRALSAWQEASGIESGPVFRSVNRHGQVQPVRLTGSAVALIVKRLAAAAGADALAIMSQTRHRSVEMVRRYVREGNLFRSNVAGKVGL
jgi:integrase